MEDKNENNGTVENGMENKGTDIPVDIVVNESPVKKILKWVAIGAAFIATNAVSFLLGRHSDGGDDSDDPNAPAE